MLERTGRTADSFGTGWSIYYQMLGSYGHILGWLGDFDQGEAACAKALRCAREVDEAYGPMYCEFFYAWLCGARGDGRGLVDHCSRAARHAEERQFALMLPICLGGTAWGHYLLGDLESARRYANKALEAQSNAGILLNAFFPDWLMGLVHMDSGDLEKARRHMQEAIRISGSQNEKHAFAASKIYMGKILARSDISPREEARACIEEGIEIFEGLQMRPWLARGYLFLGELCASTGQLDDARAYLEKAESMSREMGMDYWLRRTQEVLRTIEG
jgi:tetratricopeptide (TPR) repeat protein